MIRPIAALLLCLTVLPAAAQPFRADIDRWVAQDKLAPPPSGDLLFVGSSSIRRWEHLARDFPEYDVVQRGFGASTFTDVLRYLDEIVLASRPRLIVVFEGTNDIASGKSVDATFEDYLTFTRRVHAELPETQILFIGITPTPMRWECCQEKSTELNQRIAEHCEDKPLLGYIDTPTPFLARGAPDGEAFTSLFCDRLHLTEEGYELWSEIIGKAVREAAPPIKKFVLNPLTPQPGTRVLIDFGTNLSDVPESLRNWNRWHTGENASVLAGEHLANLTDDSGKLTGVSLTVTGGFQTKSPDGLLDTDEDEVNAETEEIFDWFEANQYDSPGGFLLEGLNPNFTYHFHLMGKMRGPTGYVISGASPGEIVTPEVNVGVVRIDKVRPDKWGRFYVDVRLYEDNRAYLSVLRLTVLEPEEAKAGQDQQD